MICIFNEAFSHFPNRITSAEVFGTFPIFFLKKYGSMELQASFFGGFKYQYHSKGVLE